MDVMLHHTWELTRMHFHVGMPRSVCELLAGFGFLYHGHVSREALLLNLSQLK